MHTLQFGREHIYEHKERTTRNILWVVVLLWCIFIGFFASFWAAASKVKRNTFVAQYKTIIALLRRTLSQTSYNVFQYGRKTAGKGRYYIGIIIIWVQYKPLNLDKKNVHASPTDHKVSQKEETLFTLHLRKKGPVRTSHDVVYHQQALHVLCDTIDNYLSEMLFTLRMVWMGQLGISDFINFQLCLSYK